MENIEEKNTEKSVQGPLVSDRQFFEECLNLDFEGMEKIRECAVRGDYINARKEMASYIRGYLDEERFFSIPYEIPENVYKLPDETDEQACMRICGHTLVSVGVPCEFGKDSPVDWTANPTFNGYKEWTWQLNRHNDIKLLAHQYRLTKEDVLAETAAELMDSWFKQAVFPGDCIGYLTDCWRTIECGIRMGANWPYILHTFYKTEYFTDDLLIDWYKSVWEHGVRLSRNHMIGNWLIMEMNGLAHIAILYPQFRNSPAWLKQAFDSLEEELKRQVYPDGFQNELTTTYHNVVIMNYQRLFGIARAYDAAVPEEILRILSHACELEAKIMMPDGTTPDINDGAHLNVKKLMERRSDMFPDNRMVRWLLNGDREPEFTSIALEYSGFMIMRTGWEKDAAWSLFDAGPFGRMHQHEDKLNVLFSAKGRAILTEGGNYAYDASQMRSYVLSTRAHNTVRVDGCDQNRLQGYSWKDEDILKKSGMKWNIGPDWIYAEGKYDEGYGKDSLIQAVHERRVFFSQSSGGNGQYLICVDRLSADEPHEYEILWHMDDMFREKRSGRISFEDTDLCCSEGEMKVICGQTEPEFQGFVSSAHGVQGQYRKLNCVKVTKKAQSIRIVTVISVCDEEKGRIKAVMAPAECDADQIIIELMSGEWLNLSEKEMMSNGK